MQNNYTIKSKCDGLDLSLIEVVPQKEIKAILQISHGMAEHKERYLEFMNFLANEGYLCVINDHRGHGESVKSKDDYGYFYEENADYIIEDLHDVSLMMKEKYKDVPLYLFGHSMGSLCVRKYLAKYDQDIDKLVVCGSPSKNGMVNIAISLTKFIKKIKGDHHRSKMINNLAFGSFDSKFEGDNPNRWLSLNQKNVIDYNNNEKCGFTFTTNGFLNLFNLMKDVYTKETYNCTNSDLPILFIAGSEDPVITSVKAWQEAQTFLKEVGYNNISNILFKGARHEILNEDNKEDIFKDILVFLNA